MMLKNMADDRLPRVTLAVDNFHKETPSTVWTEPCADQQLHTFSIHGDLDQLAKVLQHP